MANITFKAKVQALECAGGGLAYEYVPVPKLQRSHCDMNAFRSHPKFGSYANSDLFAGMLDRIRRDLVAGKIGLRLDMLPDNVTVDRSGFLAKVTVSV